MGRVRAVLHVLIVVFVLAGLGAGIDRHGARAAGPNCHTTAGPGCAKIGPHELPLSIPEFNRLASNLKQRPEAAVTLLLFAFLNAEESPDLAVEQAVGRLAPRAGAALQAVRGFIGNNPGVAARCAASFVAGARAPDFRYRSTAIVFQVRPHGGNAASAIRTVAPCSGLLGCVPLRMIRDADRGWVAETATPLIEACKRLSK